MDEEIWEEKEEEQYNTDESPGDFAEECGDNEYVWGYDGECC